MKYQRNLKITYAFEFFMNLNFMQALWMTYFAFKGLSLWEIGLAESMFHAVSLLMEIPTGVIADLYGRKLSRMLGTCMRLLYLLVLFYVDSLPMALLAFTLTALSYNLESGSDTALVYDSLIADGQSELFTRVQGKREVVLQGAAMLGVFIGGILADISYTHAIAYTFLITSLALVLAAFFIEAPHHEENHRPKLRQHFRAMMTALKGQYELLALMGMAGFFLSSLVTLHFYIGIVLKDEGLSLSVISLYLLISPLGGLLTGLSLKYLEHHAQKILLIAPFFVPVFLTLVLFSPTRILSLFFLGVLDTLIFVFTNQRINSMIQSAQRASLLSVNGMMFSLVMVILFPLVGFVGDLVQLKTALFGLAAFSAVLAFIFYRWGHHHLQS